MNGSSFGIDRLRRMWQEWTGEEDTPFDGDAPAWVISVAAHLMVILVLGFLFLHRPMEERTLGGLAEDLPEPEIVQIETPKEVYFDSEPSEMVGANSLGGDGMAQAEAPTVAAESVINTSDVPDLANANVRVDVSFDMATAPIKGDRMIRGSAVGVGTTGASGAVDRLTYEILQSLEQRHTLVVWCFDQTLSLKPQRGEIADRFYRIYEELGVLGKTDAKDVPQERKPLLSAALCYGANVKELHGPTDDVAALKKAVEGIENDPSGQERTFAAVLQAAQQYSSFKTEGRRNVMIVVVTDEVGSDSNLPIVDQSIGYARRYQMPVYVVGVPAPFGRKEVPFRFVNDDPAFDETEYFIPVEQGPESRLPEVVPLAFWGEGKGQLDYIDSGFGPYQLTRLCYETGGLYFALHPNRTRMNRANGGRMETPANSTTLNAFFDPAVMAAYIPAYMTDQQYDAFVKQNKARAALVTTAQRAAIGSVDNPATRFTKFDEGSLATALGEAQRQAAKLEPKLNELYESIKQGVADRPKLEELRWQAGFDLAYARIMAAVVRTKGYNLMLAEAKSGKAFKDPKNNTWVLAHSANITTSSSLSKMAEESTALLKKVVADHPGTPWAFLAGKELETPMGWEWSEEYTAPPAPQMDNGGAAAAAAAQAQMMKRKPNAPKPNL